MEMMIIGAIIVVVAAVLLFGGGKIKVLIKGFVGLFIQEVAKTPEGAAAVYNEAIEEVQNKYRSANDTLQKLAGQSETAHKTLNVLKKDLKDCELKCETFAKAKKYDELELFAQRREEIVEEITQQEKIVANVDRLLEDAKSVTSALEQKLKELQRLKTYDINQLKINKQMKEMYDSMDELKSTSNADKLLKSVREGIRENSEQAVGAKIVHENKTTTKIENANKEAKKLQSNDYVEQLKKKYDQK